MFAKSNFYLAIALTAFRFVSTANGDCPLVTYENDTVVLGVFPSCLEPYPVKIAKDFLPTFNLLVEWSRQCRVQMIICRSFRSSPFPPSQNSYPEDLNHFIGHAVDINLMTSDGYCGGFCMYRKRYKGARCFIRKVKMSGLRWGGENPDFCAPTQIDDARFESNPLIGNSLLRQITEKCEYFGYVDL